MVEIFPAGISTESVIIFVIWAFGTFVIGNLIYLILRALMSNRLPPAISKISSRLITYLIYAIGLYIGFSKILGLNISSIAAALGIAGIFIAISSQQILQNMFAGIIIALERPIKIGDWVEVGGSPQAGLSRVKDITLLRTILRSVNGNIIIVSNSTLITANIINYTQGEFQRVPVKIGIPFSADLDKAREIILDICKKHEKILPNIPKKERSIVLQFVKIPSLKKILDRPKKYTLFEPVVNIKEIGENKIMLEVLIWIWEVDKKEAIVSDFLQKIIIEFKRNKIEFT